MGKESFARNFKNSLITSCMTLTLYASIQHMRGDQIYNALPRDQNINKNFARPSRLEVRLEDLDANGSNEVIIEYEGRPYFLMKDKKGNPYIEEVKLPVPGSKK